MGMIDGLKRWMGGAKEAAAAEVKTENMLNQGGGANSLQDRGAVQQTPAQWTRSPYYELDFVRRCDKYLKMFNTSWEAQKLITIPVDDAMKYRVTLKGLDDDDAKKIWEMYDKKNLDQQNRRALIQERLFGGAGMLGVFSADDVNAKTFSEELKLSHITPKNVIKPAMPNYFQAINVIDVTQINVTHDRYDPFSPDYDIQPNFSIKSVDVDKSRMMVLDGDPIVGRYTKSLLERGRYNRLGFGESRLAAIYDILKMASGTQQGAYHLVNMASCLILEVEKLRFMEATNSPAYDALVKLTENLDMFRAGIVDAQGVKVHQHSATFGSVPELMMMYMQFLSAAGDIPATRFLGQAPGGLNATGESDTQNYYDMIKGAIQEQKLKPIQQKEFDWIGCSLWGYAGWMGKRQRMTLEYPELWNESAKEKADRMSVYVMMIKSLMDSGAISGEAAIKELKARGTFSTDIEAEAALDAPLQMEDSPLDPRGAITSLRTGKPGVPDPGRMMANLKRV